jgi:hypothetical protein
LRGVAALSGLLPCEEGARSESDRKTIVFIPDSPDAARPAIAAAALIAEDGNNPRGDES